MPASHTLSRSYLAEAEDVMRKIADTQVKRPGAEPRPASGAPVYLTNFPFRCTVRPST